MEALTAHTNLVYKAIVYSKPTHTDQYLVNLNDLHSNPKRTEQT